MSDEDRPALSDEDRAALLLLQEVFEGLLELAERAERADAEAGGTK